MTLFLAGVTIAGPGLGVVLAAHRPGEISLPLRLALVLAYGVAAAGLTAFILALLRILSPIPYFSVLGAFTGGVWVWAARRVGLRDHWRAVVSEVRADPWSLGAGLAVMVGIAVLRLGFSPLMHFGDSTSWRYWADGLEIVDAGRIPTSSLQYGRVFTPTTNKVLQNSLNAGLALAIGREPLPALGALLWIGSTGVALSLWSVGRELGLRLLAPLLPVLTVVNRLFLNREMTGDMATYKAEILGRMVAFAALALAIRALRDRPKRKEAVLAGLLFAASAGIHPVPVAIAVLMLGLYALAILLVDRHVAAILKQVLLFGAVAALATVAVLVLPRGELGLTGAAGNAAYEGFAPGFDPTRYLNAGVLPGELVVGPQTWDVSPGKALSSYVSSATAVRRSDAPAGFEVLKYLLSIGGLVAAVAMLMWFRPGLRHLGVIAWGTGAALVAMAWLFSVRYDLYIPAQFGIRRLFDYSSFPVVLMMLALGEAALLALRRTRSWLPGVAGALAVVVVVAAVVPRARPSSDGPVDGGLTGGFTWIRANLPCDARILANLHTEGVFEALTGRVALLEGMTPYLRPDVLEPIVQLMLDARDFFHDPARHRSLLVRESVDFVVLIRTGGVGYAEPIGKPADSELDGVPFLRLRYRSSAMAVYEVTGAGPAGASGAFPDPSSMPGYRCARGPIEA